MSHRAHCSRKSCLWAAFVTLGALVFSGQLGCTDRTTPPAPAPATVSPASSVPPATGKAPAADLTTAVIRVAEATIPAVVHIEVTEHREVQNPFYGNPFFQRYFGLPKNMPRKFKQELRALGSGMIMDTDGHVLTNAHVVAGAEEIEVLLANGEKHPGKLVGIDPKTDLAVVKISAGPTLPHVTLGDSDQLQVGEWVVAIGHPRGLDQTVTQGIISAKHRHGITDPASFEDFLQTDAAINPGNSGGPLLNLRAEVIGVNAMIASESGGNEGIGFAIPSKMASHIAGQLIAHGMVKRGWVGLTLQELTPELARSLGLPSAEGALVSDVVRGGPADRAGLRRGDAVVSFGGETVRDAAELRNRVADAAPGSSVAVRVLRKGASVELTVDVGDLKAATQVLLASVRGRLGVTVRAITPKETEQYGLEPNVGVVVEMVVPKGPLGAVGFEVGDVILEIAGRPMRNVEDFLDVLGSLPAGQPVAVLGLDHRTGNTGYAQVKPR